MKDVYLASISLGCRVFVLIFSELRTLMEQSQDLDLRWINGMVLDDAIAWCNKVAQAMQSPDSTLNQYWQEYLDHMGGLLPRGPTHLSKASLMFAIEDLVPQTNQVDDQINE